MGELAPVVEAAYKYVESLVPLADVKEPFPLWHGWAMRNAFIAGRTQIDPKIQAAAEALVKLDEDTLHNNIPYKDFMDTDDAVALGMKLAYHILGREMPLGESV